MLIILWIGIRGEKRRSRDPKKEDKPILLSIGYSSCHWCHVMEKESFENEAIAEIMNLRFINIKVDREERPDLDELYMNAVQVMTGSGGWPMTVFLTPDLIPFHAGTYFPPEDRGGNAGFCKNPCGHLRLLSFPSRGSGEDGGAAEECPPSDR